MYDEDYEYSEQELKWIEGERREKEVEKKEAKRKRRKGKIKKYYL